MAIRDLLYNFIEKELIGPSEGEEEIIVSNNPKTRYISGILFPKKQKVETIDYDDGKHALLMDADTLFDEDEDNEMLVVSSDLSEESEECIDLSNALKQSAISLTIATKSSSGFNIVIKSAKYKQTYLEGDWHKVGYKRIPIVFEINGNEYNLPSKNGEPLIIKIKTSSLDTSLEIRIFYRYSREKTDVYTVSLVNNSESSNEFDWNNMYFQTEMCISSTGFVRIPEVKKIIKDEDYENNLLLYRKENKYAIGHGCSPIVEKDNDTITITSSFLPTCEIDSIVPSTNVSLPMHDLAFNTDDSIFAILSSLVEHYSDWLEQRKTEVEKLKQVYPVAASNLEKCLECKQRIENGIEILKNNPTALRAFKYMNEAMLMQQLHYRINKKNWTGDDLLILEDASVMPNIHDKSTWGSIKGEWRPFQIAFILLNIKSIVYEDSEEHDNVELIWFPTGGGKTEAYLGLSAFTIFFKRLADPNDCGTEIIMRYTLRLLTAQQYERASALICSIEYIRAHNQVDLGKSRISIGLWVGSQTTPNTGKEAVLKLREIEKATKNDKNASNPFLITKCPWCGAEMGVVNRNKKTTIRGYYSGRSKVSGADAFIYRCDNKECYYHKIDLPLQIIDEQIYEEPPTLIIGTADKFANLPFKPEARNIFGYRRIKGMNGYQKVKGISLIIQDELHLISGPLGSTVSLYETLIDYLASDCRNKNKIKTPKIVASTATISRAKEQCKNLYARNEQQVKIFPPSCVDNGETFFAKKDKSVPGRKYVGVYAPASSSQSTTSIRLLSALLQIGERIPDNESELKDAYWTNIVYFNSLRELGTAATWINSDIKEYSKTICRRLNDGKWRLPNFYAELTSRIKGNEVTKYLNDLTVQISDKNKKAIDICLATNMISVGLDIDRLGLMTVAGQPKTTSEYIQATSRVGRNKDHPGIVFTIYSPNKPRDKSVFENFYDYHKKMYTYVEPTSVTPYSPQLRAKALAAVFFGIIRLGFCKTDSEVPDDILINRPEVIEEVKNIILKRVSFIDSGEVNNTKEQIESIINNWEIVRHGKYSANVYRGADTVIPCFYRAGLEEAPIKWKESSNPIPNSMRDVDQNCNVKIRRDE